MGKLASCSFDGTTHIFVAVKERVLHLIFQKDESSSEWINATCNVADSEITSLSLGKSEQDPLNHCYHLFASYTNKQIVAWKALTGEFIANIEHKKRATHLAWGKFSMKSGDGKPMIKEALVLSDKAGDLYAYDAPSMRKGIHVGGHTASMITDVTISNKYMATSDRDEKVRITHFPNIHKTVSYCLGHTSVVTSLTFLNLRMNDGQRKKIVVSAGWDHILRFWEPETGKMLHSIEFEGAKKILMRT